MKKLTLTNPAYIYLKQGFKEWLDIIGYADCSVYQLPMYAQEFLHYLEKNNTLNIKSVTPKHVKTYYNQLKERTNTRRGGGLSNNYLNKHQQSLRLFGEYLTKTGKHELNICNLQNEEENKKRIDVITPQEIQELYTACENYDSTPTEIRIVSPFGELVSLRDKAMLAVFYGCGLRRKEAVSLDVNDISFDKRLVHVRKGKNYKERLVPITKTNLKYIEHYLYDGRPQLIRNNKEEAFFINYRGTRVSGQGLLSRLKILIHYTGNIALQQKEITLHTLRHSIATHLLTNGMKIENIARFLGHSSLESTQIYTHLAEQNEYVQQQ